MLDFKQEIQKYKPVMEVDDIENSIKSNEIEDMIDVLKQFSEKNKTNNNR